MALYTTVVHYGKMVHTARVASELSEFDLGDNCILKTERGTEWGTVASIPLPVKDLRKATSHTIVRPVDDNDLNAHQRLPKFEMEVMHRGDRIVQELKLEMVLVACEALFGRERIIVYFQSEDRVDFRQFVKKLSTEFSTRVEMCQLNDREVAKLLGDVGTCGLSLCCKTHIRKFKPVSMKMARIQLSSLQNEKLSGQCGRLKCCLRYEYEQYLELLENLPKKKTRTNLPDGRVATILDQNILEQSLYVDIEGKRQTMTAEDYLMLCEDGCSSGKGCHPEKGSSKGCQTKNPND